MTPQQRITAIIVSALIAILVFELVRRKKLRPEFTILWALLSGSIILSSIFFTIPIKLAHLIGAELPINTLFFFGILILIMIMLYLSVKISTILSRQETQLVEISLLREEVKNTRNGREKEGNEVQSADETTPENRS